jgi:hypothetical protein
VPVITLTQEMATLGKDVALDDELRTMGGGLRRFPQHRLVR